MLKTFIASQFKRPTAFFGNFSSNMMVKNNQKHYDKIVKDLDIQPHDKVLEIGYGPGIGIKMIATLCDTCTIHGIDFSKLMYKRAGRYNKEFIDSDRVQLQYGDFLKTAVIDSNYDKIFCLNVIYFWDELKTPFEKVLSLLKKGGAFHIYMADKSFLKRVPDSVFNKYSLEQVTEALKAAGLESVEYYSEKGHYIRAIK